MPDSEHCCLCASDEGVFIDVFAEAGELRNIPKELETCLQVKVRKQSALSTKICYKCAFELGQCNEFLRIYNKARKLAASYSESQLRGCCILCCLPKKKVSLFKLAKYLHSANNPVQKLQECIGSEVTEEEAANRLICLPCRYHLDVLFDLKNLSNEAPARLKKVFENKAIVSELPKTETFVVNRKTTLSRPAKLQLHTPSDSDSDTGLMTRGQMHAKNLRGSKSVTLKPRSCGKCHSLTEDGQDMFKLHRTGVTVCKQCWITIDPLKSVKSKLKRQSSSDGNDTKSCAVFLKDVLSNASLKDNRVYKVEKDEKGNTVYIVTDGSSENEDMPNKEVKIVPKQIDTNFVKSGEDAEEKRNLHPKRSVRNDSMDKEDRPSKRLRSGSKQSDTESIKSGGLTKSTKALRAQGLKRPSLSPDSDVPSAKYKKDNSDISKKKSKSLLQSDIESGSDDGRTKSSRRDGKNKNAEVIKSQNEDSTHSEDGLVKKPKRTLVAKESQMVTTTKVQNIESKAQRSKGEDSSSGEDGRRRSTRPSVAPTKYQNTERRARSSKGENSSSGEDGKRRPRRSVAKESQTSKVGESKKERPSTTTTRSNSFSSKEESPSIQELNFKSPTRRNLRTTSNVKSLPSLVKIPSPSKKGKESKEATVRVDDKEQYTCIVCHVSFRNKLEGMTHELTHAKQIEIKLEKVKVTDESQHPNENVTKIKLEEQSNDISSTSDASHISDKDADLSRVKLSMPVDDGSAIVHVSDDGEPEKVKFHPAKATVFETTQTTSGKQDNPTENVSQSEAVSEKAEETKDCSGESRQEKLPVDEQTSTSMEGINKADTMEVSVEVPNAAASEQEGTDLETSQSEGKAGNDKSTEQIDSFTANITRDEIGKDVAVDIDSVVEPELLTDKIVNITAESSEDKKNDTVQNVESVDNTDTFEKNAATKFEDSDAKPDEVKEVVKTGDGKKAEPAKLVRNAADSIESNAELESETDIKIVVSDSSDESIEDGVPFTSIENDDVTSKAKCDDLPSKNQCTDATLPINKSDNDITHSVKTSDDIPKQNAFECLYESEPKDVEIKQAESKKADESTSVTTATEILKEVFDLATAEVQKRQSSNASSENGVSDVPETLENISKEISNTEEKSEKGKGAVAASDDTIEDATCNQMSADMPSLDPIAEAVPTNDSHQISSDM